MALPKLNASPSYELIIPSSGQKIKYRPYLVKEEKVLMIAFETGDQKQTLGAVVDTLLACVHEDIDEGDLTTFDIEYMFTQVRAKSVGESSTILLKCTECGHQNERPIDISSIKVIVPEGVSNIIQLTDDISLEMTYPKYNQVKNTNFEGNQVEVGFGLVANSIAAILTEDERTDTKDVTHAEVLEFIESMTQEQFKKVGDYLEAMPALMHTERFACESCGETNTVVLKGMQDFLS